MTRSRSPSSSGPVPTLADYVAAFCDAPATRKAAIDLSSQLACVVAGLLREHLPPDVEIVAGHRAFGGSVRRHHLDAWVANEQLGLQLGIDVKGLNSGSSVGKNWNNRVGDLHELANNHHQSFPRAVMGGVLAVPLEEITSSTMANIERAMRNLGGRRATANSANLLECACLMVISKAERRIIDAIPERSGPLRIENFASTMAGLFVQRWY